MRSIDAYDDAFRTRSALSAPADMLASSSNRTRAAARSGSRLSVLRAVRAWLLWILSAALGVPDGWDAFTGIVLGGLLLGLWEAFARQ